MNDVLPFRFSALQRAEIAEIRHREARFALQCHVSVLFNEPKLLKFVNHFSNRTTSPSFSALQRAEIAEMYARTPAAAASVAGFSALQRAEIAETDCPLRSWRR